MWQPIDFIGRYNRGMEQKNQKDGNLHKVINKSFGQPNGASFFECSKYGCGFSYDTEHASHDEPVPELDTWIEEHRNEIW